MRSTQLQSIRPQLDLDTTQSSPAEQFQNQTLRPILKLQHELLVAVFRGYIQKRHGTYTQLSTPAKMDWIQHSLQQDQRLRQLIAGVVIGQFTVEEWAVFAENEAEYMRRLMGLVVQRLQSVVGEL